MDARPHFTRMEESTREDWSIIVPEAMKMAKSLPDRVLAHLRLLDLQGQLIQERGAHLGQANGFDRALPAGTYHVELLECVGNPAIRVP